MHLGVNVLPFLIQLLPRDVLPGKMGSNIKAEDESDPKEMREQAREGNAHTYIHTQGPYSIHIATKV